MPNDQALGIKFKEKNSASLFVISLDILVPLAAPGKDDTGPETMPSTQEVTTLCLQASGKQQSVGLKKGPSET